MKTHLFTLVIVLVSTGVFAQYQEDQKIVAFDGMPVDWFGHEIAFSGDGNTMIVSAIYDDVDDIKDCGSVYVYKRQSKQWVFAAKLVPAVKIRNIRFGSSIAISGDGSAAVVGASNGNYVYYFKKENGNWKEKYRIPLPGISVDISYNGKTVMVGEPGNSKVHIFQLSNLGWKLVKTIMPANETGINFGLDIALSADGRTALIGAPGGFHGSAYIFQRKNNEWGQQAVLRPLDSLSADGWGLSVDLSLDGRTAIVTHNYNNLSTAEYKSGPTVFRKTNQGWVQQAKLVPEGIQRFEFPEKVAISALGDTAAFSVPSKNIGLNELQGELYVFVYKNNKWSQTQNLSYSQGKGSQNFGLGFSMTPDGRTIAGGSDEYIPFGNYGPGYVVTFESTNAAVTKENPLRSLKPNRVLMISPNPANNMLTVKSENAFEKIYITDKSGAIIRSVKGNGTQQKIDVSDLIAGLYFVKVEYEDKAVASASFIKQ